MKASDRFAKGRVFRRKEIHAEFHGQERGGISTPKDHPLIFIFTGSTGSAFGYADYWDSDGVFHYFGEGQSGDMTFTAGNAAIRDHARNEKEIHLFERAGSGQVRYVDEMLCSGFEWQPAKDKKGLTRKAIIFLLVPVSDLEGETREVDSKLATLEELAAAADADPTEESAPKAGIRRTFARSQALKQYVRVRAGGKCEGCGKQAPFLTVDGAPFLEAHHTLRRSDAGPGNRASVIALCPNCHARVHYGKDGPTYNDALRERLTQIETS